MRPQLVVKLGSHVSHYCENIYNFKRIIKKMSPFDALLFQETTRGAINLSPG